MRSTSSLNEFKWLDLWVTDHLGCAFTGAFTTLADSSEILRVLRAEPYPSHLQGTLAIQDGTNLTHALVGVNVEPERAWVFMTDSMGIALVRVTELSIGGTAMVVSGSENSGVMFTLASNGLTLAECNLSDGQGVTGEDPQSLVQAVRVAGLDPQELVEGSLHPYATAAAVMKVLTDIPITRSLLEEADFTVGSIPRAFWL